MRKNELIDECIGVIGRLFVRLSLFAEPKPNQNLFSIQALEGHPSLSGWLGTCV